MKFKVSSNATDAPPNVGSILWAHLMGLLTPYGLRLTALDEIKGLLRKNK